MEYINFYDWLVNVNGMSERSAKDVISRCRRVLQITKQNEIKSSTINILISSTEFSNCSMSIKSQLKRAATLYMTFSENMNPQED